MAPPSHSDDDEKERPSWRDIDRRRDRSRHVSRDDSSQKEKSLRSTWAKEQYLKKVDKLFQGAKGGKEHKKALDAIHRHYGTSKFAASVKKYLKQYGLPGDWSTLMLLLDFKDNKVVLQVIEALKGMASERTPVERQGFRDKLAILSITASSSQLTSLAERVLQEL
ncbi:MAG: hypothetical protein JSU72_11960 [Deltaproteobacteria bacterium]|nr:MAG: hypothetical protein JSU72_11960 [Deltaproteobacteria bacterium]